ncbi:MAG: hopanoid biosynthesis protein HpnM [Alphaproteobacteria bacterium]|nr:hopanoid biosynthesis protein HpnM [Alphaproteobacteria bacterium]
MMRFVRLLVLMGSLLFVAMPASGAATPKERIANLNAVLLEIMKNADSLGYAGRYEKLQPVMSGLYDFSLMSRIAVGAYWKGLAQDKREQLVDAFSRMSVATYAARFDGYSGERFEIVSSEKSVRETMLVKTRLIKSDGTPVALNYLTRSQEGEWRIIDVFLDARFSELARMRADYTAVIKRQGFDNLIKVIENKIAGLAQE